MPSTLTRTPATHNEVRDLLGDHRIDASGVTDIATAPSAVKAPVAVRPVLDVTLGTVQFPVDGHWLQYWYHQPETLEIALTRAVRTPRWNPDTEILTVQVASTGNTEGDRQWFAFTPASRCAEFLAA